jgi:hypothetical protein
LIGLAIDIGDLITVNAVILFIVITLCADDESNIEIVIYRHKCPTTVPL